jgi:hypothetical protein
MKKKIVSLIICFMMIMGSVAYIRAEGLEAPINLSVELKKHVDGYPYFFLKFDLTKSVKKLADSVVEGESALFYKIEMKIGNGEWENVGGSIYEAGSEVLVNPLDLGINGDIDIKANTYYFRANFHYVTWKVVDEYGNRAVSGEMDSPYSNETFIGIGGYQYKEASAWAVEELNRAAKYGLITDKIKDKMNGPITREELCEVIIKFYEKMVGKASYKDMKAFTDTTNPEIFKAYELGIVDGIGNFKFAPQQLTNREQVATMMYRAVKVIKPKADFSTNGAESFVDESLISEWALTPVKFMNKNGLIKGNNGSVDPKGTTTREQAVLIIVRAYEKYIK